MWIEYGLKENKCWRELLFCWNHPTNCAIIFRNNSIAWICLSKRRNLVLDWTGPWWSGRWATCWPSGIRKRFNQSFENHDYQFATMTWLWVNLNCETNRLGLPLWMSRWVDQVLEIASIYKAKANYNAVNCSSQLFYWRSIKQLN